VGISIKNGSFIINYRFRFSLLKRSLIERSRNNPTKPLKSSLILYQSLLKKLPPCIEQPRNLLLPRHHIQKRTQMHGLLLKSLISIIREIIIQSRHHLPPRLNRPKKRGESKTTNQAISRKGRSARKAAIHLNDAQ
jgi:hypothetical protein